jgi:membrane protein involved in colicin uptake
MKFYSEVTKKLYNTQEDLVAAEQKVVEVAAKKAEAAKTKKADATKVEEAFKANNAAKRDYTMKVIAARKAYNEAVAAARKAFEEAVTAASTVKATAEEAYDKALKEFIAKHPEGYHLTLKDGDNVATYASPADSMFTIMKEHTSAKDYNGLLDHILKIW